MSMNTFIWAKYFLSNRDRRNRTVDGPKTPGRAWSMKHLINGDLLLSLKHRFMNMCILPVFTYGAQTWS